jgi:hypothetical protein
VCSCSLLEKRIRYTHGKQGFLARAVDRPTFIFNTVDTAHDTIHAERTFEPWLHADHSLHASG